MVAFGDLAHAVVVPSGVLVHGGVVAFGDLAHAGVVAFGDLAHAVVVPSGVLAHGGVVAFGACLHRGPEGLHCPLQLAPVRIDARGRTHDEGREGEPHRDHGSKDREEVAFHRASFNEAPQAGRGRGEGSRPRPRRPALALSRHVRCWVFAGHASRERLGNGVPVG